MRNILRRSAILGILPFVASRTTLASSLPHLRVFKVTGCTCCDAWVSHLREAGIWARVSERPDLAPIRRAGGVPDDLAGCHTAFADGVIVEGHVPASDVKRLLRERAKALGLAVPGMPVGSPGMDGTEYGGRKDRYEVLLVQTDGSTRTFSRY